MTANTRQRHISSGVISCWCGAVRCGTGWAAHACRRHVWPRQCLDERDTHTTHNAPIGFGPLLQHLCEPFSFLPLHLSLSLFPDQDSTTCSSVTPPPLPSGTRHRAAAPCNTRRHRLALHHYPRLSPSDPRGPTPDAARQISSRRKAGGNRCPPDDPSELSDLQLHRRLCPGLPIEPEVSTPVPLWMMPRRLARRQCHAQADTAAQPPCRTDERQAGTAHQAVRQRHMRRRLRSRRVCTARSMSPRGFASTYIGPEPCLDAHDCGATHLSCSLPRRTIHRTEGRSVRHAGHGGHTNPRDGVGQHLGSHPDPSVQLRQRYTAASHARLLTWPSHQRLPSYGDSVQNFNCGGKRLLDDWTKTLPGTTELQITCKNLNPTNPPPPRTMAPHPRHQHPGTNAPSILPAIPPTELSAERELPTTLHRQWGRHLSSPPPPFQTATTQQASSLKVERDTNVTAPLPSLFMCSSQLLPLPLPPLSLSFSRN